MKKGTKVSWLAEGATIGIAAGLGLILHCAGCTMGRGAFAGLNPFTWLKPSTYIERHRQHEQQERFEEFNRTNRTTSTFGTK